MDAEVLFAVFERVGGVMSGAFGDARASIDSLRAGRPKGFPMRSVTRTFDSPSGGHVTGTQTTEVVALEHTAVADSIFDLPPDYETVDTRELQSHIPPGMLERTIAEQAPALLRRLCGGEK